MIVFYKAHVRIFVNQMTSLWITIELWEAFTVDVLDKLIKACLKRLKLSWRSSHFSWCHTFCMWLLAGRDLTFCFVETVPVIGYISK